MKYIFLKNFIGQKKKVNIAFKSGKMKKSIVVNGKRIKTERVFKERRILQSQRGQYYRARSLAQQKNIRFNLKKPVLFGKTFETQFKEKGVKIKYGKTRQSMIAIGKLEEEKTTIQNLAKEQQYNEKVAKYSHYFQQYEIDKKFRIQEINKRISKI